MQLRSASAARVKAQEILLPVKPGFIALTLAAALLVNLLPWQGIGLMLRPDFVALVLLYWCMHQPRKVGFAIAWVLGVLMDVADANVLGQHALAYAILAYSAIFLRRRILMFPLGQQLLHVLPILLLTQLAMLLIRLAMGADFPGWSYFAASFTGAALWVPLSVSLELPRKPRPDPDQV